ncbi:3-methyladenine DNA glycosylase [Nocardioides sp. CER19]|uniref:3-methyladenine DNA glycosylase n=1 Tax=Nocardioides sp. CER19 TaxID=3038538 RepID=UPI0024470B37|nr:3-methyladenine DNA glycosylase [Nocardioides sp. CER19]MDH2414136.1 3-methyladenine DNA glycosylase [Nocardioides sp. CER19]
MEVLSRDEWEARAASHRARLAPYVDPHLARRETGTKHPVHDFLFGYYSQRPAQLLRWHPGFGVGLADAPTYSSLKGYAGVAGRVASASDLGGRVASASERIETRVETVSAEYLASQRVLLETLLRLLRATASRPANLGCFGMHEWAMVYRADTTRHPVPLRLGSTATDTVVESHRIACSHFDAYRFFTPDAVPLNALSPEADDRPDFEQPGCLHGGMDLYKHAFRLSPLVPSDLVADAFELAWDIRILDMRAAPYDMTGVRLDPSGDPWTPVPVETAEGKREYAELQRSFADRAAPIRQRLIEECERLLSGGRG